MNEGHWAADHEGDRIKAELALHLVATATGVSKTRMTQRTRLTGAACQARRLAMYVAYVSFGWPIDRVGLAFGLNRSTAATACRWAEDARDQGALDEMLSRLEDCVQRLMAAPSLRLPT
jgi:chromosomal replication initiation ATPase DnaA